MPSFHLLKALYNPQSDNIWIIVGELVSRESITATINMNLANNIIPQIYFCEIINTYFDCMKNYFSGLQFKTLGLEKICCSTISNIFQSLPKSVSIIGIENLSMRAVDLFYRSIKEMRKKGHIIRVVCGTTISEEYKAKFLLLNEQISVIANDDSIPTSIKSVAPVVRKKRKISHKHNKKRKDPSFDIEESPTELILRQVKRIKQLEDALGINSDTRIYLSLLEENKMLKENADKLTIEIKDLKDRNVYLTNQLTGLEVPAELANANAQLAQRIPVVPLGPESSSHSLFSVNFSGNSGSSQISAYSPETSLAFSSRSSSLSASPRSTYSIFSSWQDSLLSPSSRPNSHRSYPI